jgi:hypothetical protein
MSTSSVSGESEIENIYQSVRVPSIGRAFIRYWKLGSCERPHRSAPTAMPTWSDLLKTFNAIISGLAGAERQAQQAFFGGSKRDRCNPPIKAALRARD